MVKATNANEFAFAIFNFLPCIKRSRHVGYPPFTKPEETLDLLSKRPVIYGRNLFWFINIMVYIDRLIYDEIYLYYGGKDEL